MKPQVYELSSFFYLLILLLRRAFFIVCIFSFSLFAVAGESNIFISQPAANQTLNLPQATQSVLKLKSATPFTSEVKLEHYSFLSSNKKYFGKTEKNNIDTLTTIGLHIEGESSRIGINGGWMYVAQEDFHYVNFSEMSMQFHFGKDNMRIGRHRAEWSHSDEFWNLSAWQPEFRWNRFNPETEGLTGIFYNGSINESLKITTFFSDLFIPNIGPTYKEENGKIVSNNPWFRTPPPAVDLFGSNTNVIASVDEPDVKEIVLQPSVAIAADKKWSDQWSTKFAGGYKPMNQMLLSYSYYLQTLPDSKDAVVTVHPFFAYENIYSIENKLVLGRWELTPYVAFQEPHLKPVAPELIAQDLAPATTATFIAAWKDGERELYENKIYTGFIKVWEAALKDRGENALPHSQFDRRFPFYEAVRLGFEKKKSWTHDRGLKSAMEVTYDRLQNGALFTSKVDYTFIRDLQIGIKLNLIGSLGNADSDYEKAYLRNFRANDNMSVDLNYVY
jgi:hypothetical protein